MDLSTEGNHTDVNNDTKKDSPKKHGGV
jgi:hypothetical protein